MTEDIDGVTYPEPLAIGSSWLTELRTFADQYCALDDERHRLEAEAEDAKARRDAAAKTILGLLKTHGAKSHIFEDGLEVIAAEQMQIAIPADSREEFHAWLKANNYWHLARVTTQQEAALLRKRFDEKLPVPGYVLTCRVPALQLRGRKKEVPHA